MKMKKLLSALCAVFMLCSAIPVSMAAEPQEPISEYAGKPLVVQFVEETGGEVTSRLITVNIPEGATQAEEDALVYQAVIGPESRSANSTVDVISSKNNVTLNMNSTTIGSGVAKQAYARIFVGISVDINAITGPLPVIEACYKNTTLGDQCSWDTLNLDVVVTPRIIFSTKTAPVRANDNIEVYARIKSGTSPVTATHCYIQGATF